jgi:hypothetical protein
MSAVRFTTLVRTLGAPDFQKDNSRAEYKRYLAAMREGRVVTVHHSECDWCVPEWAEVGHHSFNVLVRLFFPKPIPFPPDTLVLGVQKHFDPAPCLKGI